MLVALPGCAGNRNVGIRLDIEVSEVLVHMRCNT
jgi:hypothetical protein